MENPSEAGTARPAGPPDLAAAAREAVIGFLREQAAASARHDLVPMPATRPAGAGLVAPLSVARLDRIEAAAARLEADLATARREQEELQALAGVAAERAVRAAQEAWESAGDAEQASLAAGRSLRLIGGYAIAVAILVVIQVLIIVLFATTTR